MSTDFRQRLRAEMEQVKVSPRPGLVNEAYRSYRGKRRLIRALAATGTAMAIAAGTAAGGAAGPAAPPAAPALATSDEISYTIISYGPPDNTQAVIYNWQYGTQFRLLSETASGRPEVDNWGQNLGQPGGGQTIVVYPRRSWERYGTAPGSAAVPSFACRTYGTY